MFLLLLSSLALAAPPANKDTHDLPTEVRTANGLDADGTRRVASSPEQTAPIPAAPAAEAPPVVAAPVPTSAPQAPPVVAAPIPAPEAPPVVAAPEAPLVVAAPVPAPASVATPTEAAPPLQPSPPAVAVPTPLVEELPLDGSPAPLALAQPAMPSSPPAAPAEAPTPPAPEAPPVAEAPAPPAAPATPAAEVPAPPAPVAEAPAAEPPRADGPDLDALSPQLAETCRAGSAPSCRALAGLVTGDPTTEAWLLERTCDLGDTSGCTALGQLHESGVLGAPDPAAALSLYERACYDDPVACNHAGVLYLSAADTANDHWTAGERFAAACDGNNPDGCFNLGLVMLVHSEPARPETAAEAFGRACDLGHGAACLNMAHLHDTDAFADAEEHQVDIYLWRACGLGLEQACPRDDG